MTQILLNKLHIHLYYDDIFTDNLSMISTHLLCRCDRELTFRLQKQNAAIVTKMSRLNEHTKLLLFRLAESDSAEVMTN